MGTPENYREAVEILLDRGILPEERGDAFRAMIGFRNRAVRLYDGVDAGGVFGILEDDLEDVELFTGRVVDRFCDAGWDGRMRRVRRPSRHGAAASVVLGVRPGVPPPTRKKESSSCCVPS